MGVRRKKKIIIIIPITSLSNINRFFPTMNADCVICEVGTEVLCTCMTLKNVSLQTVYVVGQKLRNTCTQFAQKANNTRHLLEPVQDHEESAGRMNYSYQRMNSDKREHDGRKSVARRGELIYQPVFFAVFYIIGFIYLFIIYCLPVCYSKI